MLATRQLHLEVELVKWVVLLALAAALVLALATAAAAEPREPNRLPHDMGLLAKPIPATHVEPYFPEFPPTAELPPHETAARLWMILEAHRAGLPLEALAGWEQICLPVETAVWQEVARGAAYLEAGDLPLAELHLMAARRIAPDHPVVAYYVGILRLEQAAETARVPDMLGNDGIRMVATVPYPLREAHRTLERQAINELLHAVARAGDVQLDERLLTGPTGMEEQVVMPRVGDLLVALGADNFVGKAHQLLFGLELGRGLLTAAEEHLDQAVAAGLEPLYGYEDLAEAYLARDREADALRAARKDLQANYPELWQAGQEMQAALQKLWEGWTW